MSKRDVSFYFVIIDVCLHVYSCLFPDPLAFNDCNEEAQKDWVFQNYTFKRFEGLTQRGLHQSSHSGWAEQAQVIG